MKKYFFLGLLAGVFCSTLIYLSLSYNTENKYTQDNRLSLVVQKQIAQNIQNTISLLKFAEDILSEYSNNLYQIRSILIDAKGKQSNKQHALDKINVEVKKINDILEKSIYNDMSVFYNQDGFPFRDVPVTLVTDKPTLKLHISCETFNREVLSNYQEKLMNSIYGTLASIEELDKMIFSVSLERAKLDSYQKRLGYALEVASFLSTDQESTENEKSIMQVQRRICDDLHALCVQSANGIYNDSDRKIIQVQYNELADELMRINQISGKRFRYPLSDNISLLSQSHAEKAMLSYCR